MTKECQCLYWISAELLRQYVCRTISGKQKMSCLAIKITPTMSKIPTFLVHLSDQSQAEFKMLHLNLTGKDIRCNQIKATIIFMGEHRDFIKCFGMRKLFKQMQRLD